MGTRMCQGREGVGEALRRGQTLCHHLHTSCTASGHGSSLWWPSWGPPSHLLLSQKDFKGWSKSQQPFWEEDPSWTKHCPAEGLDRAEH